MLIFVSFRHRSVIINRFRFFFFDHYHVRRLTSEWAHTRRHNGGRMKANVYLRKDDKMTNLIVINRQYSNKS